MRYVLVKLGCAITRKLKMRPSVRLALSVVAFTFSLYGCSGSGKIEILEKIETKTQAGVDSILDVPKKLTDTIKETVEETVEETVTTVQSSVDKEMIKIVSRIGNFVEANDDKRTISTYSRSASYALQGATAGVITGIGLNCVTNVTRDKRCLDKVGLAAAIGGGMGGAGGWIVASRQRKLEGESITLDQRINSTRLELDQARRNREAAQRLTSEHVTDINKLKRAADSSSSAQRDLENAIAGAKETLELLQTSNERMKIEITSIEDEIEQEKDSDIRAEFVSVRTKLIEQKVELQNTIDRLNQATTLT